MKGEMALGEAGGSHSKDSDPLLEKASETETTPRNCSGEMKPPSGSDEIEDEDIEAASVPCCRICLECDVEPGDELISPCMCKGTQQFAHRTCLGHGCSVKASEGNFSSSLVKFQIRRLCFFPLSNLQGTIPSSSGANRGLPMA